MIDTREEIKPELKEYGKARNKAEENLERRKDRSPLVRARVAETTGALRRRGAEVPEALSGIARRNPLPAALLALGATWLALEFLRHRPEREWIPEPRYGAELEDIPEEIYQAGIEYPTHSEYGPDGHGQTRGKVKDLLRAARERAGSLQHKAGQIAGQVGHTLQQKTSGAQERARNVAGQVGSAARRYGSGAYSQSVTAKNEVWRTARNNPILVGATTLAFGTIVGLAASLARRRVR